MHILSISIRIISIRISMFGCVCSCGVRANISNINISVRIIMFGWMCAYYSYY